DWVRESERWRWHLYFVSPNRRGPGNWQCLPPHPHADPADLAAFIDRAVRRHCRRAAGDFAEALGDGTLDLRGHAGAGAAGPFRLAHHPMLTWMVRIASDHW